MAQNAPSLCRNCGKLMGTADECPYCGARRGSPAGYVRSWMRKLSDPNTSVTHIIMGACCALFLVTMLLSGFFFGIQGLVQALLAPPSEILLLMGLTGPFVFSEGYWWGLFTSVFSHIGLIHLGFNMYVLSILGPLLERSVSRSTFWSIFVLSGAGGAFLTALMGNVAAGASGAIMGVLGASLVLGYLSGRDLNDAMMQTLIRWAVLIFAFGILVNLMGAAIRIDNWGHLGGFLTGAALVSLWSFVKTNRTYRDKVSPVLGWALLAILVLAFVRSWMTVFFGAG